MKKNFLLHLIILLLFASCSSQNKRIETELMECYYQTYSDNGAELKRLISNYQSLLVKEKVIADSSAKSYLNFYQKIAEEKEFEHVPSKSFLTELQNIEKPNGMINRECQSRVLADSSSYDTNKIFILEDAISSVQEAGDLSPSLVAKQILTVLTEEDFELEYYRLRTLFLFDMLNVDYGIDNKLRTATGEIIEHDLTNALKISTNEKNDIFVNGQKVNIEQLKKKVKDYGQKNKGSSVIAISASRETMYSTYIEVQNTITSAIKSLRDKSAITKYQLEFEKLTDKQKDSIKQIYPIEIVETAPE
jgi:biopolymer transport protein ExbD